MKKIISIILFHCLAIFPFFAQDIYSSYFLNEWSRRSMLNASFKPEKSYFTLPFLGTTEVGITSNSGLSNYIFKSNDQYVTFLHQSVDGTEFINQFTEDIFIREHFNVNLFSLGIASKNEGFWSFDISLKENLNINIPLDFFRLAKLGMSTSYNLFDLNNLSFYQSNLLQTSVGFSKDLNSKLRVGLNAKFLVGLSSESLTYSTFDVVLADEKYTINALGESKFTGDMITLPVDENEIFKLNEISVDGSVIKPSGIGFGCDIGISYKPISKLTIALGLNDIGYVKWNSKSIKKGVSTTNFLFRGFTEIDIDSIDIKSQLNQLKEDVSNLIKFKNEPVSSDYFEHMPFTINVSAEYSIFENEKQDILLGLLYRYLNSNSFKINNLVAAITLKPFSGCTISGTCELLQKESNRFGVGINFSQRKFNLFLASDFIFPEVNRQFYPINKFNYNLALGCSFGLNKH